MKTIEDIHLEVKSVRGDAEAVFSMYETLLQRLVSLEETLETLDMNEFHRDLDIQAEARRIRSSPYQKMPRAQTDKWVEELMRGRDWISPASLAEEVCNGDLEYARYLRGSFSRSLREGVGTKYQMRPRTGSTPSGQGYVHQYKEAIYA